MTAWTEQIKRFATPLWLALALLVLMTPFALSQETTGGLQGTITDPSGAVVPHAKVVISGNALIGDKVDLTDSSGYYRFANLPPGTYAISVTAAGFKTYKRGGMTIEVGHLPTVNVALEVGAKTTTIEVTEAAPLIDTTSTVNMTNISKQVLQDAPTGISFQSVIQYAPMAREEPLAGYSLNGQAVAGGGGAMPGSAGNGLSFGYSIGGAADSETSYLVEGQDTENISGGYSSANVPMDFIDQEVVETSGVPAQYGGALGGVVNVILKKGGNQFHGSIFSSYESSGTDGNPVNPYLRYDPTDPGNAATGTDPVVQFYQAQKEHFRRVQPGILVTGPILTNRIWFAAGFNPLYNAVARSVNFGTYDDAAGNQYFTQDTQTYYGYGRIDAELTSKVRVFGSWLYQFARETGQQLPVGDPIASQSTYLNTAIEKPLSLYTHGIGSSSPNATYNFGSDITLTQDLVSTTRFGYFFTNYHDFGWPTTTPDIVWEDSGIGATDNNNLPLPAALQQGSQTNTQPYDSSYTLFNASKHIQFNQDFAFYKGGWWGTHNFKFGYQLNYLSNVIHQNGNVPQVQIIPGAGQNYSPFTTTGVGNCDLLTGEWNSCTGQYGYVTIQDFSTILTSPAVDWNHALYAEDAWTLKHGVTLTLGLRVEKESLPAPGGVKISTIDFPWSDKIEPRLGAAWDPTGTGKMKIFGSYGVVNDVMKLLVAQTSWGAQSYEDCTYPLGPDSNGSYTNADLGTVEFANGRACPNGPATTGANFNSSSNTPPPSLVDAATGVSLIENVNLRPLEPVAPNVKPYRQHEYVLGWDYQISPGLAFEARYNRRRLDHIIEDASLSDVNWGETYAIVNPGEGVDSTLDGYATYLASLGESFGVPNWSFDLPDFGTCPGCPPNPKAIRNYDGLALQLTMSPKRELGGTLAGTVSYIYSSQWGNYTGLTTTDQNDGGITGRNSPDTTRAFDEPFYYFGANGKSNAGPLPTDRPNVFKGYGTYTIPWWKGQTTTIGLFQQFLQGSPVTSYIDLLASTPGEPYEATYIYGRGNWVNMDADPSTGTITLGTPYARRTPWFTQSDIDVEHTIKVGDHKTISFQVTATNAFNQRAVTAYFEGMNSWNFVTPLYPGTDGTYPTCAVPKNCPDAGKAAPLNLADGAALYSALESGYSVNDWINGVNNATTAVPGVIKNSQYGKPLLVQASRAIRLTVHYTF